MTLRDVTYKIVDGNKVTKVGNDLKTLVWEFHSGSYLKVYTNDVLTFDGNASTLRRKLRNDAEVSE